MRRRAVQSWRTPDAPLNREDTGLDSESPPKIGSSVSDLHRCYRDLGIGWVFILVWLELNYEFGKCDDLGNIFWILVWASTLAVLAVAWIIHAAIRGTSKDASIALGGSLAFAAGGVGFGATMYWVCRHFGLGHWPPSHASFVARFREERAAFEEIRDLLLSDEYVREAKREVDESAQDPRIAFPPTEAFVWPDDEDSRRKLKRLGIEWACVDGTGRLVRLTLWGGQYGWNPVMEKGVLYVRPPAGSGIREPGSAVKEIGDGWYVFEN